MVMSDLLGRLESREMLVHKETLVLRDPRALLVCLVSMDCKDPLYVIIVSIQYQLLSVL